MKRLTVLVFLMLLSEGACAQPVPSALAVSTVASIPLSKSFRIVSKATGEAYRIKVFIPDSKPSVAGYPSIYVLDGNILFGSFAGAVRNESQAGDIDAAVVVGIESDHGRHGADRTFDFTSTDLTGYEKSIAVDLGSAPRFGGYDAFHRTIEDEIKPAVAQMAPLDSTRQAIVGWSLGGLFVLHTMFKYPETFKNFVAISPSIWRDDRAVLDDIPDFERHVKNNLLKPGLFIGVGGTEEQFTPAMTLLNLDQSALAKEVQYVRMVGNAKDLAANLEPYFAKNGFKFSFRIFDGESHNTVPWSAINPVLKFLLPMNRD